MNIRVAFLLTVLSTVACGPSGSQNVLVGDDEGGYVDSGENELYDNNDVYEEEHEDRHNGTDEYEEEYEDNHDWVDEHDEEYEDIQYEDEDEEEDDDMPDGTDEEEGEYIKLPDWMDVDLDQLPIDKMSMLSSAKDLTQMMTLLDLTIEQRNKLDETRPVEIGARTIGDIKEIAECKPELEVVRLESPPKTSYLPPCFRLPRCGGCCTGDLLSCQPIETKSIKIEVLEMKSSSRSRRSTGRSRRKRHALGKYTMVDQVEHLSCGCQCRIKEHHCDKSIQEYKEAECACICKNRDKETECARKNTHYWDRKSCSCKCTKIRECSTGEEFDQNTCRCAVIAFGVRSYNSVISKHVCKPSCGNGRPVRCQCKKGWKGKQCNKPKKSRRRLVKLLPTPTPSSRPTVMEAICDPGCGYGKCVSPNTCECQRGWSGDQCNDPICDPGCVHGKCLSPNTCECQRGWRGDQCNDPICDPGCVHGSCVSPNTCDCQEGWRGKKCKKYTCESQKRRPGNQCQDGCNCIPLDDCEPLLTITRVRSNENRNILRKALCNNSNHEVCCLQSSSLQPTSLPQTSLPPTSLPQTSLLPTSLPPKSLPPKSLPPTSSPISYPPPTLSPTSLLPSYCGQPYMDNNRIYGGTEVPMGKYPWIALLGYTGCWGRHDNPDKVCYHCGGSVINERYVLTAAHCVTGLTPRSKKLHEVVLGEWDQATKEDCDQNDICLPSPLRYGPEEVIWHPNYKKRSEHSDDIALIRLSTSVNINNASFIRAVCLPEPSMDVHQVKQTYRKEEKFRLSVAGWGVTEDKILSEKLLEVKLPLIDISSCNITWSGRLVPGQICAGGQLGEDSCNADSGGPLVLPGRNITDPYVQVGLVSFGSKKCGREQVPGVYTEVNKYREWIEENLKP